MATTSGEVDCRTRDVKPLMPRVCSAANIDCPGADSAIFDIWKPISVLSLLRSQGEYRAARGHLCMVIASRHQTVLALALCAASALGCQAFESDRAWLGVDICNNSNGSSSAFAKPGILVLKVEEGSPAFMAGIRLHDIIVGLDGQPIASAEYFVCVIAMREPGSIARLSVVRGSERKMAPVALGHWPDELRLMPSHCEPNV